MAISSPLQERIREAVRETVRKYLAEEELPASADEALFTQFETVALAAGDAVSEEVFAQQLSVAQPEQPPCPHCGRPCQVARHRERQVQTRRGLTVSLQEPECYCPACRRAFFPSVPAAGPGRGL
jgi:hypothetical protein